MFLFACLFCSGKARKKKRKAIGREGSGRQSKECVETQIKCDNTVDNYFHI